ncbi:hypothetical protein Hamer_G001262 [Homarus americanus]|uniref:Uncharacterized protein n=1 Tax=Homarus americanus TaxID=6706 RepID=A0A8J5N9I7_HOMAM|nr:hypothetical protein Hamer_G001262 [Homarus americanus]
MKWVEVTGMTGDSVRVKLVEQTILLNTTAEIEGLVIFSGPLVVGSLSTTTGIVNGVNLLDLYYNAWFVDEASQLSRKLVFQARIILKELLPCCCFALTYIKLLL